MVFDICPFSLLSTLDSRRDLFSSSRSAGRTGGLRRPPSAISQGPTKGIRAKAPCPKDQGQDHQRSYNVFRTDSQTHSLTTHSMGCERKGPVPVRSPVHVTMWCSVGQVRKVEFVSSSTCLWHVAIYIYDCVGRTTSARAMGLASDSECLEDDWRNV